MTPAGEQARLSREAERLTALFRARPSPDDLAAADEIVQRHGDVLAQIQAVGEAGRDAAGADAAERTATIEHVIELNRELIAVVEAEKAGVRRDLAEISETRRALGSYHGPNDMPPAFCDRLG
jgi:hypothetical protein